MTKEIEPNDVLKKVESESFHLIDVRGEDEFSGELGHIKNAKLITLGEELTDWLKTKDKSTKIIFVCRSGGRSGKATVEAMSYGITEAYNQKGGMLLWNELGLETEK